ncbi:MULTISPECIES: recombinase family protein [unclassified Mesorhizobium]|uniref:recombinase family protein n=1 Tax=unclassified Mesorhizobium TaxID=325217 RepID=UPI001CD08080|nr:MULTISPECIES: recombinase family protein [unclassified Mesorhizobium]MBZ9973853.1 recombinase family protein [Mesorhizobium sp. BR-1-1-10]
MDKLEAGDILIVTNLDRLSRDTIQVCITVKTLAEIAVRACFLALGGADLTSSTCTMTMNAFNTVAQFERDLLIARTQSGLTRANSERSPVALRRSAKNRSRMSADLAVGAGISATAGKFALSRPTICV